MVRFLLFSLGVLVFSIGIAIVCMRRGKTALGILLGLLVIAAAEVYLQVALQASIQNCIDRACEAIGLPPGCSETEFGCGEWSGLSVFIYWVAGFVETVMLLITVLIGYGIQMERRLDREIDKAVSSK